MHKTEHCLLHIFHLHLVNASFCCADRPASNPAAHLFEGLFQVHHVLIKHPAPKGVLNGTTRWLASLLQSQAPYNVSAEHKLHSQAIKTDYMKYLAQPASYTGLVFQYCSITLPLFSTGKQKLIVLSLSTTHCMPLPSKHPHLYMQASEHHYLMLTYLPPRNSRLKGNTQFCSTVTWVPLSQENTSELFYFQCKSGFTSAHYGYFSQFYLPWHYKPFHCCDFHNFSSETNCLLRVFKFRDLTLFKSYDISSSPFNTAKVAQIKIPQAKKEAASDIISWCLQTQQLIFMTWHF